MTGSDSLSPVREHMLHSARTEADLILAEAHSQAASILRQARRGAEEAIERARAQGQTETAHAAAAERTRGREQARSIVLGARREAHQELRDRVLAAAIALRREPGYERLLGRLTVMAAAAAGRDPAVAVQPAGGVEARSDGVVVDCTLPRLAALAVDALGDRVRELWTP
jgi:vacuolar-type H+-ATPase subunit E/Vma4